MCNKYRNTASLHQIGLGLDRQLGLALVNMTNEPIPEVVFPRRGGLALRPADGGLEPFVAHWNLTPFFHRGDFKAWKASTNNCRSETMATSPAFREAVKKRRAIIPMTSYVEWTGPKGSKTEHDISSPGGMLFAAGLWENADAGPSYTMVMMDAAGEASRFHDRMPILLDAETARTWLDTSAPWEMVKDEMLAASVRVPLSANPPEPVMA